MIGSVLASLQPFKVSCLIDAAVIVCLLGIAWLIAMKMPRKNTIVYVALLLLSIRFLLVGNPLIWKLYDQKLKVNDVGWRQKGVITKNARSYFKEVFRPRYLAIGSSQSGAMFGPYSRRHSDFTMYTLPGMGSLDFVIYKKRIVELHPEHVILFISEFDLARIPAFDAAKLGPRQGLQLPVLLRNVHKHSIWAKSKLFLKEMAVGEFFPEYKYAFIFKTISQKILHNLADGAIEMFQNRHGFRNLSSTLLWSASAHAVSPGVVQADPISIKREKIEPPLDLKRDARLKRQLKQLRRLQPEGIAFNLFFLEEFIAYCRQNHIKVIMVEGHYNPKAYSAWNRKLNIQIRKKLHSIASNDDGITFIPRSFFGKLTPQDYKDNYHVKSNRGLRLCKKLIHHLESTSKRK